jgi:aminoglycoside 3'-phosphotransferase-2
MRPRGDDGSDTPSGRPASGWPLALARRLVGFSAVPIRIGRSAATVLRFDKPGAATRYLKYGPDSELGGRTRSLAGEAERLAWMGAHGLPVPAVEALIEHEGRAFLLLAAVEGFNAAECAQPASAIVETLAAGLRLLHGLDARGCPFDAGIAAQIEHACRRLAAGLVDERDFDAAHAGWSATDLFHELVATRPAGEDLVFTHGDYCLPNVILRGPTLGGPMVEGPTLRGPRLAGFVDVGRAGLADPNRDLALASRSIAANLGAAWVAPFFAHYGLAQPDLAKLAFYRLIDEFF